ncbi:MAG: MDR family MFS transporter [Micromonosporaceae bacterium]
MVAVVRRWFGENVGGLPRAFWHLWLATLVNRLGGFIVIYLAVYLVVVREFAPSFAGLVVGLYGAGAALGVLVGGVLADRWGRRPTMISAQLAAAVVAVALGLVTAGPAIALLTSLLGALTQAARPAMSAMMTDVVADGDRLRAFSLNYWAINLGFAGAALLAGVLAGLDYRLLFFLDAATTALGALVVFRIPETRPRVTPQARPRDAAVPAGQSPPAGRSRPGGIGAVLADRVFLGLVGTTLLTWMIVETLSMMPIAMRSDDLPLSSYGAVIAVNGILIVLGQLFVPRLVRGSDRSRTLALAAVFIGVGFGTVAVADQIWVYAVSVAIWTVGEMLMSPSNSSLIADLAPAALRGRYNGVFSLGFSVASFAAPVLAGLTMQYSGEATLWIGCLVLGLVAAGLQYVAGPARERRVAVLRAAEVEAVATSRDGAAAPPRPEPAAA